MGIMVYSSLWVMQDVYTINRILGGRFHWPGFPRKLKAPAPELGDIPWSPGSPVTNTSGTAVPLWRKRCLGFYRSGHKTYARLICF